MSRNRHPLRAFVIALFRRGEIVSVREAELVCDAAPQVIRRWLKAEGINVETRRLQRLSVLRTRAMADLDGAPMMRRPSKAERLAATERAVRAFNKKRGRL